MNLLIALLVGALAGAHIATWGMYKDAPHEGFTWSTYARSIVVATVVGLAAQLVVDWDLTRAANRFVLWGLVYCLERGVTELWKGFIRDEDQAKYFIPMQFAILGKPVKSAAARLAAGLALVLACVALALAIRAGERPWPGWLVALTVGSAFGWISAIVGAWKDAPIEGFETFKFFRSPLVAVAWALVVTRFTGDWLVIALAAEGLTVASIETYKTFGLAGKPRGKFAGKPITFPEIIEWRKPFARFYLAIWIVVLVQLVVALASRE